MPKLTHILSALPCSTDSPLHLFSCAEKSWLYKLWHTLMLLDVPCGHVFYPPTLHNEEERNNDFSMHSRSTFLYFRQISSMRKGTFEEHVQVETTNGSLMSFFRQKYDCEHVQSSEMIPLRLGLSEPWQWQNHHLTASSHWKGDQSHVIQPDLEEES